MSDKKLHDLVDAAQRKQMSRRELLERATKLGVSAAVLGTTWNMFQSQALAADFDWKKHSGKSVKLLLNKHPYPDAMVANLDNF